MKKLLAIAITAVLVFGLYANDDKAKQVKLTNYKDVISEIEYPQVCKTKGIEGKVIVSLMVDANGEIVESEFLSFPCDDLKEAVSDVLPELKFSPARDENGKAIKGKFILPVNFKLNI